MNYYDFTIKLIKEAGEKLLVDRKTNFLVSTKNNNYRNIVTSVDISIDNFIKERIAKVYPDHCIYSEESGMDGVNDYQWTIDPIDGTSNFSRAIPHFSISLGMLRDGVPEVGAVFNPVTGELFSFKRGEGAFLNENKIEVSKIDKLRDAYVLLHAGRGEKVREWGGESYKTFLQYAKKTSNLACSSLDACFIAAGRIEANIYGTLSLHDVTPAIGILREAGGVFCGSKGREIDIMCKTQKIFMANNQKILDEVLDLID